MKNESVLLPWIKYILFENNKIVTKWLIYFDILSLLIASLVHDLDHPGLDNAFMIATSHELAERYNEISVLENNYASILSRIISKP